MEQEAKRLLMARLDECLKAHAQVVNANDIGSIYDMQQLAELHYYLKAEHQFTAEEVEALLTYSDPLDVARWCWEENAHAHSFPICELLREIHAEDRFERVKRTSPVQEKHSELVKLLGRNFNNYKARLLSQDKEALFDRAEEISAAKAAYKYIAEEYTPVEQEVDFLLRYDNPLNVLCDYWPTDDFAGDLVMETIMHEMYDAALEERNEQPKSVRERLQRAAQSVMEQASGSTDAPKHDTDAR